MKTSKIALSTIVIAIALTACNNRNTGSNADRYAPTDSTSEAQAPTDTYKTNVESPTNGPDNAPPNKGDTSFRENKPTHYNDSGGTQ